MHYVLLMRQAFSLVELSIVLVILGLLTGGILAGQSLIRASEMRAVSTEASRFLTASYSFRDKYFAIPGDMRNATAFWGKDATNCNGDTGTAGSPGTCNGNGDGMIAAASAANSTGESFQYWKQLALAGMIEGNYTGLSGSDASGRTVVPGTNAPRSKLSSAGYGIENWGTASGSALLYDGTYNNIYVFGAPGLYVPEGPILKPEEAWNIDTKMDDGRPPTGKVRPFYRHNYGGNVCANAANEYNLSNSTPLCNLAFITGL